MRGQGVRREKTGVLNSFVLALLLFCGALSSSSAHGRDWGFKELPADLEAVDIYLHTVDVGNLVFNNFGHTALRVHDKSSGRDMVYNWGIFDFRDPISFSLRFYKGILYYSLGVYPYASALAQYEGEGRSVWEDRLNLDSEQKRRLLERLIWNSQPENRAYSYQYFFDNCSTRPRDYIDEAIEGQLKRPSQVSYTPQTFRDMMMAGYQYNPGIDLFLDMAMNSRLDRPISVWEKMFHPLSLRDSLLKASLRSESEAGPRPLVASSRELATFPGPKSYEGLAYPLFLVLFGLPLAGLALAFFFLERQPWMYRAFALVSLPLLSFGAFFGVLMPLTWAVSAHLDLHHNALQLLFWPLDGIFVLWALAVLKKGRALKLGARLRAGLRFYCVAHLLVSLLLPVLRSLDLVLQNIDRPLVYVLPPYLTAIFLLFRLGLSDQNGSEKNA